MPSSPGYNRDYKQEYANYQGKKDQIKKRASRNKARNTLKKQGKVRLGDNMDVHHSNTNPRDNSSGNLKVVSKTNNRSFPRNKKAGKK